MQGAHRCRTPWHGGPGALRGARRRRRAGARCAVRRDRKSPRAGTRRAGRRGMNSLGHPEERPEGVRLEGRTVPRSAVDGTQPVVDDPTPAAALTAARRIVLKIGSAVLVGEGGEIRRAWLEALVDDVARCRRRGQELIIVSSGAIAVGRRHLGLRGSSLRLEEKQAAAATGQIRLAHAYQEALARHGITVAQILLTPDDTEARQRHLNARATFAQLLALGAVPVVNENDTVATAEIRFGDNDRLAARVAQMVSADMLVLLSDIDGLYTTDPRHNRTAVHIPL